MPWLRPLLSSPRRFRPVGLQTLGQSLLGAMCSMLLVLGLAVGPAQAIAPFQLPTVAAGEATWLVDEADIISRINEGKISGRLSKLAEQTGQEVRLVTIRHFDYGETIQTFTDKVFERWYPTAEDQANQVLLVLDEVTKTVGIRVGEEAAALLPDDIATSVAQETVLVPLLQGDKYNQAFLDGTDRLVAVISGQPDPGAPVFDQAFDNLSESTFASAEDTEENRGNNAILLIVLLVLATVIPMATYYWYVGFGN
ncbi:photosystem II repair protein Psb32 [Leptolyngbya sp. BL0902]|uniref:photosystem II repair protein Psb32 n=1 Tax=Leptolyngbya sp. BL0902 TaxID=1115757 RepID=UPI0018E7C814|nr:TPM domain-containing protein [Leptolyngbya sp. BL0902]